MNINLIIGATRKAATLLLRDFNEIQYLRHSPKSMDSFISNSKLRTGEILTQEWQKYFPDHLIINAQDFQSDLKHESYILFDPLEGQENIQNNLRFFAISAMAITKKHDAISTSIVLNFPALDIICCASSLEGAWLENYQNSSKIKLKHSGSSTLIIIDKIEKNVLEAASEYNINLENIRSFGSKAYSIMQLATGNAGAYLANNQSILYTKIANFISQTLAYFNTELPGMNIYTPRKLQTLRTLSLKRQY